MRVVQCQAAEGGRLVLCAPGADEHFPASVQRLYGAQLCALAEAQTGEPYRLEWVAAREEGDHRASA